MENEGSVQHWVMSFLEDQLSRGKIWRYVALPWTVFLIAGGVGLFAIPDAKIATAVFAILGAIVLVWLLAMVLVVELVRRRSVRHARADITRAKDELEQVRNRADLYATSLIDAQKSDPSRFSIELWQDTMRVEPNGDTVIIRDMILVAGEHPLDLVSSTLSANAPSDPGAVQFDASWIAPNGDESVPIHWTAAWSDGNKTMAVFLHYTDSVAPRTKLEFRLTWKWPKYSKMLLEGKNEPMNYKFNRPCEKLSYSLVLAPGCAVNDRLRIRQLGNTPAPQPKRERDGSVSFAFEMLNVTPGTTVGFEAGVASR